MIGRTQKDIVKKGRTFSFCPFEERPRKVGGVVWIPGRLAGRGQPIQKWLEVDRWVGVQLFKVDANSYKKKGKGVNEIVRRGTRTF